MASKLFDDTVLIAEKPSVAKVYSDAMRAKKRAGLYSAILETIKFFTKRYNARYGIKNVQFYYLAENYVHTIVEINFDSGQFATFEFYESNRLTQLDVDILVIESLKLDRPRLNTNRYTLEEYYV